MGDHYETLGIPRDADAATIKAAHRRLAQEHHPDKTGGDDETFKAVQSAYDTLKDPDKRAYYDRTGQDQPRARNEIEEIAPFVVGAFDRAVEQTQKSASSWAMLPKGLGRTDIVKLMTDLLRDDQTRGKAAVASLDKSIEQMEEMRRRLGFTGEQGKNIIDTVLLQRIRDAGEMRAKNEQTIALVERAIEHIALYGWELDPVPEVHTQFFHTGGRIDESYVEQIFRDRLNLNGVFDRIKPLRPIKPHAPGTRLDLRFHSLKPRRRADRNGVRPHTCILDAEGRQVPPPRGSWSGFERRVAELQGR